MQSTNEHARSRARAIPLLAALLALAVVLGACGGADKPSSAAAGDKTPVAGSGAPEQTTIKVATLPVAGVAPVYIAVKNGYFAQEGLTVEPTIVQGGPVAVSSLISGDVAVAFTNYLSLVLADQQGIALDVVAEGERVQSGHTAGYLVAKDSSITSPKQLEGKRVATNSLKNLADLGLDAIVRAAGGDPSKITFVEVPIPDMPAALQRGTVDAAFLPEPVRTIAEQTIGARQVVDLAAAPLDGLPANGYAVTDRFARANPNTVGAFQRALEKGARYAIAHPEVVRQVLQSYARFPPAIAQDVPLPAYQPRVDAAQLQRNVKLLDDQGILDKPFDFAARVVEAGQAKDAAKGS